MEFTVSVNFTTTFTTQQQATFAALDANAWWVFPWIKNFIHEYAMPPKVLDLFSPEYVGDQIYVYLNPIGLKVHKYLNSVVSVRDIQFERILQEIREVAKANNE